MRTGMEAVYQLCNVDRGVPEVWNSEYDVRDMLNAAVKLRDGRPLTTFGNPIMRRVVAGALEKTKGTYIYDMLKVFGALQDPAHPVNMRPGMHFDETVHKNPPASATSAPAGEITDHAATAPVDPPASAVPSASARTAGKKPSQK